MDFGINFTPVHPGQMAALAARAEEVGFESLWIGEHVLVPLDGVPERDRANWKPTSRFVEPWVALAHLAAVTTRVRLGTCVVVLPLHSPVHLARAIATADVLSGGRISVGVGVGVVEAEYRAVNEGFADRGARMDEQIQVMAALFDDDEPEFHGAFYDFPPSGFEPKPVQRPRPPLLLGGNTPPALRRAVALGDGWLGGMPSPDATAELVGDLQRRREVADRPPLEITLLTGWAQGYDGELARAYGAAGVDRIIVTPWTRSSTAQAGIEEFARAARF
jgi:probable F420-dependent oxidoreductase